MFSVWRVLGDRVFTPKNGPVPERRVNGYPEFKLAAARNGPLKPPQNVGLPFPAGAQLIVDHSILGPLSPMELSHTACGLDRHVARGQ